MMKSKERPEQSDGRGHEDGDQKGPRIYESDHGGRGGEQSLGSRSGRYQRKCDIVLEVSGCQREVSCDIAGHHSLPVIGPLLWA